MTSRGVALVIAVAACHRGPTPRARVLAAIAADSSLVVVADAAALVHPRARAVIDALRPHWPASLGCVIDSALAGEQVGLGVSERGDTTIVVLTDAAIHCPALSKLAPDLWVATIGAGHAVTSGSVLDDDGVVRARPYLMSAPIALATTLEGARVIATAQPEPLDAWLVIESPGPGAAELEASVHAMVARLAADPTTAPFAAKLTVTRSGSQIVARLAEPVAADLPAAVRTALAWGDATGTRPPATFACPAIGSSLVASCVHGTTFAVWSLVRVTVAVSDAPSTPVVANGTVIGMRLGTDIAPLGLVASDVVVAVDSQLVRSHAELVDAIARARRSISLRIRRGTTEAALRLLER